MINDFSQFIGQEPFKQRIELSIKAANVSNQALKHFLISGSSGTGKTTFANLVAKEFKSKCHVLHGPNLQKPADVIGMLTKLKDKDIVFIDEIHSIGKEVEETLYPVLSTNKLNMVIGKEYNTKNIVIDLPSFTLIGATTLLYKISTPLLNRFISVYHFQNYNIQEIELIISQLFKIKKINIEPSALAYIVPYARLNPRVANNLVIQIEEYYLVYQIEIIDLIIANKILKFLNLFQDGLTIIEYNYLKYIYQNSEQYTLGLSTIAKYLSEPLNTIINVIEPYLLQSNYLIKTARGRKLTKKAINLLKIQK